MSCGNVQLCLRQSFEHGRHVETPFSMWLLEHVLPDDFASDLAALPLQAPEIDDTGGRRETHNSTRSFLAGENLARFPVCRHVAEGFQDSGTARLLEGICDISLTGSLLRIEYCLDQNGFWLEPHTDIGAKLFTLLIYLGDPPPGEDWGTDVFNDDGTPAGTPADGFNHALAFVPSDHTWHGFRKRPITGVRRSIIVNYVKNEWRSRHELSFPDRAVA